MAGPALRILGIDPGLRITGFGIIEKNGGKLVYVVSGCIKSGDAGLPDRLKIILENLREVIAQHQPHQIALEKVFVNVNPASTLALGQARGTAICAAVDAGLPVSEYTALQVKQAVVGNGHAKKEQVQQMVKIILGLAQVPSPHDAQQWASSLGVAHEARLPALGPGSRALSAADGTFLPTRSRAPRNNGSTQQSKGGRSTNQSSGGSSTR